MIKSNFKPTCLAINMGAVMNSIRNGLLGNGYSLFQFQGPVTVLWTVSGPTGTTEYLFTLDHLVLSSASAWILMTHSHTLFLHTLLYRVDGLQPQAGFLRRVIYQAAYCKNQSCKQNKKL